MCIHLNTKKEIYKHRKRTKKQELKIVIQSWFSRVLRYYHTTNVKEGILNRYIKAESLQNGDDGYHLNNFWNSLAEVTNVLHVRN
jgi:hypothetical protein